MEFLAFVSPVVIRTEVSILHFSFIVFPEGLIANTSDSFALHWHVIETERAANNV